MPSCCGSNGVAGFSGVPPTASLSITKIGAMRPPRPTVVGAIVPVPVGVQTTSVISVVVRFVLSTAPGRNSSTRPVTVIAWPTAGLAPADPVNTKMPSDVSGSLSAIGSW